MGLAAFFGGGKDTKGFMGRAVEVNDQNKALDQKKELLDYEYALKGENLLAQRLVDTPPFTLKYTVNGQVKTLASALHPSYVDDHKKLAVSSDIMDKFSLLPEADKEAIKKDQDVWQKLQTPINIIATEGYKSNINDVTGDESYNLPTYLRSYQNEWDYANIWAGLDEKIANKTRPVSTEKDLFNRLGITKNESVGEPVAPTTEPVAPTTGPVIEPPTEITEVVAEPLNAIDSAKLTETEEYTSSGRFTAEEARLIGGISSPLMDMVDKKTGQFKPTSNQIGKFATNNLTWDVFSNPSVLIETVSAAASNPNGTQSGMKWQVRSNIEAETKKAAGVRDNQAANLNGMDTAYELIKLTAGYFDVDNNYVAPVPLVGRAADVTLAIKGLVDSVENTISFVTGHNSIQAIYQSDSKENKTLQTPEFLERKYGGISVKDYQEYMADPDKDDSSRYDGMYRVKALQIHLAFQLAIAMQGYQGGKAVSDADFDRAWQLLSGGTARGNFLSFTTREASVQSLKIVQEQFAATALKNKAWLEAADGTKDATAEFVYEAARTKSRQEGNSLGEMTLEGWFTPAGGVKIDWDGFRKAGENEPLDGPEQWGFSQEQYELGSEYKNNPINKTADVAEKIVKGAEDAYKRNRPQPKKEKKEELDPLSIEGFYQKQE